MVPVFTDASSAILLFKAGLFEQLVNVVSIVMAPSVYDEITQAEYPGAVFFRNAKQKGLFTIKKSIKNQGVIQALCTSSLDSGEKETIELFLLNKKGFILTDDGKAARYCTRHKLPFINALLVPKLFYYNNILDEKKCKKDMDRVSLLGRYSDKIKKWAYECTYQDLSTFISGVTMHGTQ